MSKAKTQIMTLAVRREHLKQRVAKSKAVDGYTSLRTLSELSALSWALQKLCAEYGRRYPRIIAEAQDKYEKHCFQ